jgi:hypothetical protein
MSRKNRRPVASPAVVAEIAAEPVAPAAAVAAAVAAVDSASTSAKPARVGYAVTAAMLASLDPTTLIPIGSNHENTRNKTHGTVVGIPTRYLYATPNGQPVDPSHPNHPTLESSLSLAVNMLVAARAVPDFGITTNDSIVRSCGIRFGAPGLHDNTRTAGDVDAADFAVGFTARVLDSVPRTALPVNLRTNVTCRLMRRGLRATRIERIDFVRTILNSVRTALNP